MLAGTGTTTRFARLRAMFVLGAPLVVAAWIVIYAVRPGLSGLVAMCGAALVTIGGTTKIGTA